jgi:uncharacterized protein
MNPNNKVFDEHHVLHELKHYLPAQAPLKDFIHHNTLHAFQNQPFHQGIQMASELFGYKVSLSVDEYRALYKKGRISENILDRVIQRMAGSQDKIILKSNLLEGEFHRSNSPRIGKLRASWKRDYKIDLDSRVHPLLFRVLGAYLDQGISMWKFPIANVDFLSAVRELESDSGSSLLNGKRAHQLLLDTKLTITDLLKILVGDEALYEHYLFDQQFAHQGWSGMMAAIELNPQTLIDRRKADLKDLIHFELIMEIDALDEHFGANWKPLSEGASEIPEGLFDEIPARRVNELISIWQEALEWSFYDEVLAGVQTRLKSPVGLAPTGASKTYQAMFCIDDRECSIRRHLEAVEPNCETYGTAGFFGVEFYYKPEEGKFYDKLCPAPVFPKYLIKEVGTRGKRETDAHFNNRTHGLLGGWLISQTFGFWSAMRLFINIFKPSMSPATASSFKHMNKKSRLTVENIDKSMTENMLQIGFSIEEMAIRVENLLRSIGLTSDFAPLIYVIGHGSSSVNNPYYAAYDCGACSGRPGSVNARVVCEMANNPKVRELLRQRGIAIPDRTRFVGGLHDTSRDEVVFYDEENLSPTQQTLHIQFDEAFEKALDLNAKERSRRFDLVRTHLSPEKVHDKVKLRSVSLFEPRPELNHATNSLCIVGGRGMTRGLFLDRRSFLNSYDYKQDPKGEYLLGILKAVAPVCGGINLEYYFSRVDNQKLGAGSKLPHNVMGLFGVANGIDGDLRPGLPVQMIELHDPLRLMVLVEHDPNVVLEVMQKSPETYEWFINEWVRIVVYHPDTKSFYKFGNGQFKPYTILHSPTKSVTDLSSVIENTSENLPVYLLS